MKEPQDWKQLKLVGGQPCLDFVNTVDRDGDQYLQDWFRDAADVIGWAQYVELVSSAQAKEWLRQVQQQPAQSAKFFNQAIQLREALYRIFSAFAVKRSQAAEDLQLLNTLLSEMQQHLRFVAIASSFTWEWTEANQLEFILWQIARSTTDLLTSSDCDRLRECAGVGCGWVFLDFSRNRSRRWCDMEDCGNRAKANRHYDRKRKT
ncbi:CGNR zinc finger domain-containing protein [Leptolyngbya sp. FACHB-541]|uniref:CGNR zinc finger domain-containing protein n=1 Tax=Leptolyngbya sp. FACHB-541 TaxID=2692810 RepID=UPI0016835421|nr:ABATE domain-containing protein [Leptolyngbya sp. FACHB-541]MBD1871298.1 CGNR zinc finger domain-containing protein [Cyanobacteria bacterium FACHB-471]MBD2000875.1 CGNR zinc finger domain-containing protein [Leptolyngbya sp. FACHB-541]